MSSYPHPPFHPLTLTLIPTFPLTLPPSHAYNPTNPNLPTSEPFMPNFAPWKTEPDRLHWIDPTTNLDCLILRGPSGALCGYVGLPSTHPYFGRDYDDVEVEVHGDLTFAGTCTEHICHGSAHGDNEIANSYVWWLGFDCAHCDDYAPKYEARLPPHFRSDPAGYKTLPWVKQQVINLAAQLQKAGN